MPVAQRLQRAFLCLRKRMRVMVGIPLLQTASERLACEGPLRKAAKMVMAACTQEELQQINDSEVFPAWMTEAFVMGLYTGESAAPAPVRAAARGGAGASVQSKGHLKARACDRYLGAHKEAIRQEAIRRKANQPHENRSRTRQSIMHSIAWEQFKNLGAEAQEGWMREAAAGPSRHRTRTGWVAAAPLTPPSSIRVGMSALQKQRARAATKFWRANDVSWRANDVSC
mmetsp:Transcript_23085/g.72573  ORF Transcript_23085/g.72573 Transcript_23085/m.72573 type:complete len:228 (+) Transcript_23085:46-729(+)